MDPKWRIACTMFHLHPQMASYLQKKNFNGVKLLWCWEWYPEMAFWILLPYFGKRKQVTYHINLSYWCFYILPSVLFRPGQVLCIIISTRPPITVCQVRHHDIYHWHQWKWQTHFALLQEISLLSLASFCQSRAEYASNILLLDTPLMRWNMKNNPLKKGKRRRRMSFFFGGGGGVRSQSCDEWHPPPPPPPPPRIWGKPFILYYKIPITVQVCLSVTWIRNVGNIGDTSL